MKIISLYHYSLLIEALTTDDKSVNEKIETL
jgi:hypothetical protein